MKLAARFTLARGELELDVDLTVEPGRTMALVGPNGAGKTSCLHALAGLVRIDAGSIALGDEVLDGGRGGRFVEPAQRGVGFVFQDLLLFAHLSVLENVAYGLRSRGMARQPARSSAAAWLERVGLEGVAQARPGELSGGQAQRVALARALATEPRVLLLDEPLSAVDSSARAQLRRELRAQLSAFDGVALVVAHDALDAFTLADRVAVLEEGRIVQENSVAAICSRPRSRFVADLVGINLFEGTAGGGRIDCAGGGHLVAATPLAGPVLAAIHPRSVALFRTRPEGSPRNVWRAPITSTERLGDRLRVRVGGVVPMVAEITPAALEDLQRGEPEDLWVAVKATEIEVYSA